MTLHSDDLDDWPAPWRTPTPPPVPLPDPAAEGHLRELAQALAGEPPPCASDPEGWFPDPRRATALTARAEAACLPCRGRTACDALANTLQVTAGVWAGRIRDAAPRRARQQHTATTNGTTSTTSTTRGAPGTAATTRRDSSIMNSKDTNAMSWDRVRADVAAAAYAADRDAEHLGEDVDETRLRLSIFDDLRTWAQARAHLLIAEHRVALGDWTPDDVREVRDDYTLADAELRRHLHDMIEQLVDQDQVAA